MGHYLAIDAGGTKAEYILADETRVLAHTHSDTIKRMRTTAEIASANLCGALAELQRASGVRLEQIMRTCIGTAGNTVPLVTDWLYEELGSRIGGELIVHGDVDIALDAAFPNAAGVLILAGTGSNVAGRGPNGEKAGAGGYGPVLSDQGSGHRIGQEALRAVFLAIDEERETMLLPAILEHWNLTDQDALVAYANTCPPSYFSPLSHVVTTCAEQGDAVSLRVLQQEGETLAHLGVLVHRRLERLAKRPLRPSFAFAGSILRYVGPLCDALTAHLLRETSNPMLAGMVNPIEGALWRARTAGVASAVSTLKTV